MDPLTIGLLGGGASLLGSIFSSSTSASNTQAQIQASEQQQATQNAFTERMSNTAYQRASADMTKAGLNPMMMFGSGSAASTPAGSSIQAPMPQTKSPLADLGSNVGQVVNGAIQAKTFDKLTQEIANLQTDQALRTSQDITERMRPADIAANVGLKEAETRTILKKMPSAELEGTTAKDVLDTLPAWLRQSMNVGAYTGGKVDKALSPVTDVFNTLTNSALKRKGLELLGKRSDLNAAEFENKYGYHPSDRN